MHQYFKICPMVGEKAFLFFPFPAIILFQFSFYLGEQSLLYLTLLSEKRNECSTGLKQNTLKVT